MLLVDYGEEVMLEPGSHNTFEELLENHLLSPPKTDEPPAPLYPLVFPYYLCCKYLLVCLSLPLDSEFLVSGDFILSLLVLTS